MNNKNMAKIAIWTSISALEVGVAAIIIACPRKEEPGFDYTGAIVGILSLLVTCLIGYEIFRAFIFNERVKKEVKKKLKNAEYSASCLALAQLGNALYGTGQHALALQSLFNALIVGEMAKMSELGKEAVENSIALLEKISDELRDVEVIRLESAPELVNRMKSAAYKTNSEKVISLDCHLHPCEVQEAEAHKTRGDDPREALSSHQDTPAKRI